MNNPQGNGPQPEEDPAATARRTGRQVLEDIREHGLLGGLGIPGIRQLNALISYSIIGGLAAVGTAVAGYFVHNMVDNGYQEEYKATLQTVADRAALTCGLDQPKRQEDLFTTVYDDVLDSKKQGLLNRIPVVGTWMPTFEWLPSKRVRDTVIATAETGVSLYPATITDGFKDGVSAVIYNDGSVKGPVLAYRDLGNGSLDQMMDAVQQQGGLKPGIMVLAWNNSIDKYETVTVATGEKTFQLKAGKFTPVAIPANPCLTDRSLIGKSTTAAGEAFDKAKENAKKKVSDWTPDLPSLPSFPSLPWGKEKEAAPIPVENTPATAPQNEQPTVVEPIEEPKKEEPKGGWRTYLPRLPEFKSPF